ncbi:MAG: permease [Oscillatoriales cyanobacterium SM2_2_1]|nr:permease [Oscillatoriales cyanobacterium SM2_2_1]
MGQFQSAFTLFLSLLVEAIPFLLLGVMLSGALMVFVDEGRLIRAIPRHPFLGALTGSLIGFLFPVCECGNVPVARRLLTQGAPASVAVAFLLAAPTINPIVIWATWTAFRDQPELVLWRVVLSLVVAVTTGTIFSVQKDIRPLLQPRLAMAIASAAEVPKSLDRLTGTFFVGEEKKTLEQTLSPVCAPQEERWRMFLTNTLVELRELGAILIFGSAIAAIVQVWVPRDVIVGLGQGPITSILAMMTLAAVVSICSTVDAFFALSFAGIFTTGSLLSFLVFGPMIDLKAIGLILTIFQRRAVIYLFLLAGQMTFLGSLFSI